MGIAGKHFVTQRKTIKAHDQRDAHLLAIGAVIARVAALGQFVAVGLAFKVRARHVIQQHFVLDREQLAIAFG
jgi:hypothetical protein